MAVRHSNAEAGQALASQQVAGSGPPLYKRRDLSNDFPLA